MAGTRARPTHPVYLLIITRSHQVRRYDQPPPAGVLDGLGHPWANSQIKHILCTYQGIQYNWVIIYLPQKGANGRFSCQEALVTPLAWAVLQLGGS